LIQAAEKDATERADKALLEFGYKRIGIKNIYIE